MAKIMLADDSDAIRQVLRDILLIGNHEVVGESADGDETIKKFSETKPELLLLDLAMPKKDGLAVIKEITAIHPDAKIIIITATDNHGIIKECLDAGAKTHISKPFDFDNVLKIISEIVSN